MKKTINIIFILFLFIGQYASAMSGTPPSQMGKINQEAAQMANDFTNIAMTEFRTLNNSELDYPGISSQVQQYSLKMAEVLLGAGVDKKTSAMIMQKASVNYGQALKALFKGNNYDEVIQEYSGKIADLFSQEDLDLQVQSQIISMSSDNLESMNSLFQDLTE